MGGDTSINRGSHNSRQAQSNSQRLGQLLPLWSWTSQDEKDQILHGRTLTITSKVSA